MQNVSRIGLLTFLAAGLCGSAFAGQAPVSVKNVRVLNANNNNKDAVEIEIEGSDRLVPQTQVLVGPERLVVDFPNAAPGAQLRNQPVNRGDVKDVRVGLFHSNPPVTRLVLDLKSPQSYQIFPSGKSLIIKISGKISGASQKNVQAAAAKAADKIDEGIDEFPPEPATRPGLVTANYGASGAHLLGGSPAVPALEVAFRNGLLSIKSNKASLSEILFAVHQRTGADVSVSAGAEQEKVAAEIGPGPAPEVLARLLNGSKFNYLILSSPKDPRVLDKVILSPKAEGAVTPLSQMNNNDDQSADDAGTPPPIPQKVEPPVDPNAPPFASTPQGQIVPPGGQRLAPQQPPTTAPNSDDNTPD